MENKITLNDARYPKALKVLGRDAPKQLYYKGNWDSDIFENCLAVVGSRKMTVYGRQVVRKLVLEIASRGITIVSGFMYGIDAEAHKAALDVGGKTIAVMPCGIDIIHPEYQVKLYDEILKNQGLVISEYEGNSLPANWTYPRRNRIVAGLSKAVMVVEAGERSGSLITANFARKFKRKIFAVPGPLTSVLSKGINQLIKQGAEVVTGVGDVLEFFGKSFTKCATPSVVHFTQIEKRIVQELQKEPMEIDLLSRSLNISAAETGKILSFMELKRVIYKERGKYYVY